MISRFIFVFTFLLFSFFNPTENSSGIKKASAVKASTIKSNGIEVSEQKVSENIHRMHFCHSLFGCMNIYKKSASLVTQSSSTLVMLVGLNTDYKFLEKLKAPSDVTILAIEYPIGKSLSLKEQVLQLVTERIQIQGVISSFFLWLKSAKEFNQSPIHIMMISFGTYITPKSLALSQEFGFSPASTIFAYGGAGLHHFFEPFLDDYKLPVEESVLAEVKKYVDVLFRGFENEKVLEELNGPFLVIMGGEDKIIPSAASEALFEALSEPKQLSVIPGPHIGENQDEVIDQTMSIVLDWVEKSARP